MPVWIIQLGKLFISLLTEKLVGIITKYAKEKYEERRTNREIQEAVTQLRNAKTEEEIRAAIRNISI